MAHPGSNLLTAQQILNASVNQTLGIVQTIPGGFGYTNISTSAQTLVKTGAGVLGKVAVNVTLTSAVRGYDNTVSGGSTLFTIPASTTAGSTTYDVRFSTGLVVSTGAAADNITVMYN